MLKFVQELRRRGVFRTAGIYVVSAWIVIQAADVFFPGWGVPDTAVNMLLVAAVLGFPLALVFGWFFDVTASGIVRTPSRAESGTDAAIPLRRSDYLLLASVAVVAGVIAYETITEVIEAPNDPLVKSTTDGHIGKREKLPNSIAVLPFANLSNDPGNDAFCDGVSDELINRLSAFERLHVIARTSSFAFKDSDVLAPQISDLLGVRHLLQGSVRVDGDRIRISAQLVDAEGVQQWSDTFDRKLEEIFALQTEIADLVATTVVPRIVPARAASRNPDLAAYRHFLIGREHVYRRDIRLAKEELSKAIELDPAFADAQAEFAVAMLLVARSPDDQIIAREAIDSALALVPGMPRALAAKALLLREQRPPDHAGAVELLENTLAAEPNMVDAMNWLVGSLKVLGRDEEALVILERAHRIDPLHVPIVANLARAYGEQGDTARQEQLLRELTAVPKPVPLAFVHLSILYKDSGRLVDFNLTAKDRVRRSERGAYSLALSYALLGDWAASQRWLETGMEDSELKPYNAYYPSLLAMWRGEYQIALRSFDQAIAAEGLTDETVAGPVRIWWGISQALGGDYARAVRNLGHLASDDEVFSFRDETSADGVNALAWSYLNLGMTEDADELLSHIESVIAGDETRSVYQSSQQHFFGAMAALLGGDKELALTRLQRAVANGWSDYYLRNHDPRLASLRGDPRFGALMSEVKINVDRQRAEVESLDAAQDATRSAQPIAGSDL